MSLTDSGHLYLIDFRSDTVTRPSSKMREVMAQAVVGDDVFGDDPTVNDLETWVADRHGFESALFTSSGTQANLLGILSHCGRGDEYLCGQDAHNYKFEAGGAAVLGSVQPQPIENSLDGSLDFAKLEKAVKPDDSHFAKTRLLSLENTIGGKVLPMPYLAQAREFSHRHGLALHLDGARVYNAAVALGVDVKDIAQHFDSMTVCLSKGLGAPVGSLLFGNSAFIARARRLRKMVGGGMRQAGILAAAGKLALLENVERLADDHANAIYLAEQLNTLAGVSCDVNSVQTNIVFLNVEPTVDIRGISSKLKAQGILMLPGYQGMRLVTHLDVNKKGIDQLIAAWRDCL